MKALTIWQPFAYLIVTPAEELPPYVEQKRVENRPRNYTHRGKLLIHAGASRKGLEFGDEKSTLVRVPAKRHDGGAKTVSIHVSRLRFGYIIGVADVVDCIPYDRIRNSRRIWEGAPTVGARDLLPGSLAWLEHHPHCSGPFCLVLRAAAKFPEPISYRGKQGLFEVPDDVVAAQLHKVAWEG